MPATTFDAFLSYSQAIDGQLATRIQAGLEKLARPWYRTRAVRIFRDQTNLAANPNLWGAIELALQKSRWLILLASENSSKSKWVEKEINWWLSNNSIENLIIVLSDGDLVWDPVRCCFDPEKSTALPQSLMDAFKNEPLYVDMRWAKDISQLDKNSPRFRTALIDISSSIRGISKDEMDGEAISTIRRNRYWVVATILTLTIISSWAIYSKHQAETEALRNSVELDAKHAIAIAETKMQSDSLPLAILAGSRSLNGLESASPGVLSALRHAIGGSREISRFSAGGQVVELSFENTTDNLIGILRDNRVRRWPKDKTTTEQISLEGGADLVLDENYPSIRFSNSRSAIIAKIKNGKWRVWGLNGMDLLKGSALEAKFIDISPELNEIYGVDKNDQIFTINISSGRKTIIAHAPRSTSGILVTPDAQRLLILINRAASIKTISLFDRRSTSTSLACSQDKSIAVTNNRIIAVGCGQLESFDNYGKLESVSDNAKFLQAKNIGVSKSNIIAISHTDSDRISVFDETGRQLLPDLMGVEDPALAVNENGTRIATGGYLDATIRIYDLKDRGRQTLSQNNKDLAISTISVCPDRNELFWGTRDGEIYSVHYPFTNAGEIFWATKLGPVEYLNCITDRGFVAQTRDMNIIYARHPNKTEYLRKSSTSPREGMAYDENSNIVFGLESNYIQRWSLINRDKWKALNSLQIPSPDISWHVMIASKLANSLVLGSYDGRIVSVNSQTGAILFEPVNIFWSNVWGLNIDVREKMFTAGGAGTDVAIFDWKGNELKRLSGARFQFSPSSTVDSENGLIAYPTRDGAVVVLDWNDNIIGPPIGKISPQDIAQVKFTKNGYLIIGDPEHGLSIDDFDANRLLHTSCQLLRERGAPEKGNGLLLHTLALDQCKKLSMPAKRARTSIN